MPYAEAAERLDLSVGAVKQRVSRSRARSKKAVTLDELEPPTGDELTRLLGSMKRNVLERVAQAPAPSKRKSVRHIFGLGLGVAALLGVGAELIRAPA